MGACDLVLEHASPEIMTIARIQGECIQRATVDYSVGVFFFVFFFLLLFLPNDSGEVPVSGAG